MTHGTRRAYQRGCDCLPCKAANASYMAQVRRQHAKGQTPLGAHVSAVETRQLINRMLLERFTRGQIARLLGLKRPRLELHTDVITFRNALKVRRLYRLRVNGDSDRPHV